MTTPLLLPLELWCILYHNCNFSVTVDSLPFSLVSDRKTISLFRSCNAALDLYVLVSEDEEIMFSDELQFCAAQW
jgi:hypothetical protein